MKTRVLFLSTDNACRSQMAEGLANHDLGEQVFACSGGTAPSAVHPNAAAVMAEVGIDISGQSSKDADAFAEELFDFVITLVGEDRKKCLIHGAVSYCRRCKAACPHLEQMSHGGKRLYLSGFPEPSEVFGDEEQSLAAFRKSRDAIRTWILRIFD